MDAETSKSRSPWLYVPTLYFQQGLPVILVQQFSVLLYKKLGIANDEIGLWTSLIAWPWIIKMFWGPMVDVTGTKRKWIQSMQLLITIGLAVAALAVTSDAFLPITLSIFLVLAFFSATHDIALDSYYLHALKKEDQAFFVGIRSTFFRLAMVFTTGTLVIVAGMLENRGLSIAASWQWAMLAGAGLYGALMLYGLWAAPKVATDHPVRTVPGSSERSSWGEAFRTFFKQPQAITILLFILLYRFGESMLSKMSGLFLLDPRSVGGLGLETIEVGAIIGNVGVISLVAGGLLGGIAISKFGLRPLLWPMVLFMNLPNLLYIWAAHAQPGPGSVYGIIAVDQFGYGFGLASYMVYVMYVCQSSRYQTTHYAIATAMMALGAMVAGIVSGYLQQYLGYFWFFVAVCIFTIPGMVLLQMIPLDRERMASAGSLAAVED